MSHCFLVFVEEGGPVNVVRCFLTNTHKVHHMEGYLNGNGVLVPFPSFMTASPSETTPAKTDKPQPVGQLGQ